MITNQQLKGGMPWARHENIEKYGDPIRATLLKFKIDTPARQCAFLAQIAHESGSLKYSEEIASGQAYEGRKDLGNIIAGDGVRFKGRGLIQITGRVNYKALSDYMEVDFIKTPELLKTPLYAAMSAGWYWDTRHLNALADLDTVDSFVKITKKINGGTNGLDDRMSYLRFFKHILE